MPQPFSRSFRKCFGNFRSMLSLQILVLVFSEFSEMQFCSVFCCARVGIPQFKKFRKYRSKLRSYCKNFQTVLTLQISVVVFLDFFKKYFQIVWKCYLPSLCFAHARIFQKILKVMQKVLKVVSLVIVGYFRKHFENF